MGLLAVGAGAGQGLDDLLRQLLAKQQMQLATQKFGAEQSQFDRRQTEDERSNRATEQYRSDALKESAATRGAAAAETTRQHNLTNEDRDTTRVMNRIKLRPIGGAVPSGEFTEELKAGVPFSNYDYIPPTMGQDLQTGGSLPASDASVTFKGTQDQLQKSDAADLARLRADDALRATTERERQGNVRLEQGAERVAQGAERNSWGPPPVGVADPSAPGGVRMVARPAAVGQPAPAPPQERTQSINNDVGLDQLDRLQGMFDKGAKDLIGPAEGRLRGFSQKVPGVPVNTTFADFEAATSAFRNAVIKAITGAQMSEPEALRIRQQIPEVTDKPEVWQAKARQTRQNLEDLRRRMGQARPVDGAAPADAGRVRQYDPATGTLR